MKNKKIDKERLEDVRRKKLLFGAAAVIVVLAILSSIGLSRMAVRNVDTKKGIQKLNKLEQAGTAETEAKIAALEEQEKKDDEAWKNRPLAEKFANAAVLGDSITTGFTIYEVLDTSHVVAEKGVHLDELSGLIDTVVNLNPKVVFLALGLNDVSATNGDTDTFTVSYKAVVDTIRERLPEAKIYVNSIQPVTEKRIEEEPAYKLIPDYNVVLQVLCEEEGITFIDNSEILKEEYYEEDGEHMKMEYYPLWGEHMAEVAGI